MRMYLSSYQGRQGMGAFRGKSDGFYVVNDVPQVACDNHCGTYVGGLLMSTGEGIPLSK
jgi:hypothetical protein